MPLKRAARQTCQVGAWVSSYWGGDPLIEAAAPKQGQSQNGSFDNADC